MQVIRGTRAPFLAAACAILMIGAGASDSTAVAATESYSLAYFTSTVAGPDGCPVSPSIFDPRELCSADLGADWLPLERQVLQICPPGPAEFYGVIQNGTLGVIEHVTSEPDDASAVAGIRDRVRCVLNAKSKLLGVSRQLPAIAIAGSTAEAQLATDDAGKFGGGEIATLVAVGHAIVAVGVIYEGASPDNATVLRIVAAAIHRFQNPRPSGGPFAPIVGRAPVLSSAP